MWTFSDSKTEVEAPAKEEIIPDVELLVESEGGGRYILCVL